MNRTKIDWTDYTWNPITGCKHGCWYCYAYKMFERFHRSFEPEFHPERLGELDKIKKPCRIFVCSVADLFAEWTKPAWRRGVLERITDPKYKHITFQLLTKSPERITINNVNNIWVGVTVTNQSEIWLIQDLIKNYEGLKFVSFEPILGEIQVPDSFWEHIDWAIVGKLTGSGKVKLDKKWVESIDKQCRKAGGIPTFLKNNLKLDYIRQQWPISKR